MRSRAPFTAQLRVFHQNITCSMHTFSSRIESFWISSCRRLFILGTYFVPSRTFFLVLKPAICGPPRYRCEHFLESRGKPICYATCPHRLDGSRDYDTIGELPETRIGNPWLIQGWRCGPAAWAKLNFNVKRRSETTL